MITALSNMASSFVKAVKSAVDKAVSRVKESFASLRATDGTEKVPKDTAYAAYDLDGDGEIHR